MVNNVLITKPSPKTCFSLRFLRLWTLEAQIQRTMLRKQRAKISKGFYLKMKHAPRRMVVALL